jgi:thermitase
MKIVKILLVIAVIFLVFIVSAGVSASSLDQGKDTEFAPGEILVKFKPNVLPGEMAQAHRQHEGQVKKTITAIGVQVVTIPRNQEIEKIRAYSKNPLVAYAEPNYLCQVVGRPDDNYFDKQWGMNKVEAPQAWDVTTGNREVNIAILDTGVDLDHPDLGSKVITSINFSNSSTTDDIYGHGTHVAGIAAASTNNGVGVAGLGYDSTIMNVKVLGDNGSGFYTWVANGIIWAADNGAEVINLSLGSTFYSVTLENAVRYAWDKGVVVIAAAGNNASSIPFYPAYYTECMAVAATDANDSLPYWSNHGDWVDVAAPGASIYSTLKNNVYGYMSGTSMASPHTAGLAALVFAGVNDSNGNGRLNDEVRSKIETNCDEIGLSDIGNGRINAYKAIVSLPTPTTGKIAGKISDASDGSPIEGTAISDGTRSTVSDANGNYTISNVPEGSYTVTASKDGYETSSKNVTVLSSQTITANFSLTKTTPTIPAMWVDSIILSARGKNLFTDVKVVSDSGAVAGVNVALQLEWRGGKVWNFNGTTDSEGVVSFKLNKASSGDYLATVNSLACSGYIWDDNRGIVSASYTLTTGNGKGKPK